MRSAFPTFTAFLITLLAWAVPLARAQEDFAAKAQNERELVVYGTALAAQFDKFAEPFRRRYPFIKTQYSRTTGEALTSKILREVAAKQLSAAGEFPVIIYSDIARTEELKRKGAPIDWVRAEPHITVLVSAAITREAKHPAAARLFMNYLASDEGQKEVLNIDKPPALPKFQPDYLRGVKFFPADWTLSDSYEEHNKIYREIFWKNN